jgi:hypothetical protein
MDILRGWRSGRGHLGHALDLWMKPVTVDTGRKPADTLDTDDALPAATPLARRHG